MKKLFLATTIIFASLSSDAFTLLSTDPNMQGWANPEVRFAVNVANCPSGFDVSGLIESAGSIWSNIATSRVKVKYGGSTTSSTFGSPVTVYCAANFNAVTGASEDSVPAAATAQQNAGRLSTGLVILNASSGAANIANFDHEKLKIIVAHEIGHVLGLGHSEDPYALMYYNASARQKLSLSQDDIDGMTYLYPRNELGGDGIYGCARVSNHLPPPPPNNYLALLIAIITLPLTLALAGKRFIRT